MDDAAANIRIELLSDRSAAIPLLSQWFIHAWEPYYGPNGSGDAAQDLQACCNTKHLPVAVVALDTEGVCGTAALKQHSVDSHRHLSPWLAALLVDPEKRHRGIGTRLIQAIEELAWQMQYQALYVGAGFDAPLYERRGWAKIGSGTSLREPLNIFRCYLGGRQTANT